MFSPSNVIIGTLALIIFFSTRVTKLIETKKRKNKGEGEYRKTRKTKMKERGDEGERLKKREKGGKEIVKARRKKTLLSVFNICCMPDVVHDIFACILIIIKTTI